MMVAWTRVGEGKCENGHLKNIFGRKSQQYLPMHQIYVMERKNQL